MYLVPVLINYALSYLRYSPIKFGFFSSCHYCLDQPIPQEYGQKPTSPSYSQSHDQYSFCSAHRVRGNFLSFTFFPQFF